MDVDEGRENGEATTSPKGEAVCRVLVTFMKSQPERDGFRQWKGQPETLLMQLRSRAGETSIDWPTNAQVMSRQFRENKATLHSSGVYFKRTRTGRSRGFSVVMVSGRQVQDESWNNTTDTTGRR